MRKVLMTLALIAAPQSGVADALAPDEAAVFDHVFVAVQAALGNPAAAALARAETRAAAGNPALDALLRDRDASLDALGALRDRQAALILENGGAGTDLADIAAALADQTARIASLDARLDAAFPAFRARTNPPPLSRVAVQALLAPDEALVLIAADNTETYVWAIAPGAADWHRAALPRADLDQIVRSLRAALGIGSDARAVVALGAPARTRPFNRTLAHGLYRILLEPLEHVFADADHLLIVTDGPLSSLPLSVLVTRPPQGADNDPAALRATAWLLRDHALSTLPSVSALHSLRNGSPRAPAREPFIGFGDPLLGHALPRADRGVYGDLARIAELAPLPGTRTELLALAATMGAGPDRLFMGAAATETQVRGMDLSGADVIAFATHGLLADGLPGLAEPALVLTPPAIATAADDALLTASEAAGLTLNASLIILSACDTAGSDGAPGAEGLSGLARAFIYAGARALLVSHWPVDDAAAARLTTGMLAEMQANGTPRAQALRRSALALMADTSSPDLAHPRLWAPFVVVGEGGPDG